MSPTGRNLMLQLICLSFGGLSASAEQCFALQKLRGCVNCLQNVPDKIGIPAKDCWTAKVLRDFDQESVGSATRQVLSDPRSGNKCYQLSSECPLKCLPASPTGFESWLPCRSPARPAVSHLIFSIKAGVGIKVWDLLVTHSGNEHLITMETDSSVAGQPDAFKSDLLDKLDDLRSLLPMQEIRVVVYKADTPVVRLTFDASKSGLTAGSWFERANLKSSWPVAGIAGRTFNYFSVAGHVKPSHERRFFINYDYGGCPLDRGVLMVMDTNDVCSFAQGSEIPRILYTASSDGRWHADIQRADRMSIFVA